MSRIREGDMRARGLKTFGPALALVLFSSALLILAFPGFELHYLAWAALVPLMMLIRRSGLFTAFLFSVAAGFLFYCGLLWWILRYDGMNPVSFILANMLNASYFGVFGLAAYYFQKKLPSWIVLTFPAWWVVIEYAKNHAGFLSFPWGVLGYSQYSVAPVAGVASFTGVYGVSFLIVAVNTLMAEILLYYFAGGRIGTLPRSAFQGRPKVFLGILAGMLMLFSASLFSGYAPHEEGESLRVTLVQGSVYKRDTRDAEKVFRKYYRLTLDAADSVPQLIAWPSASAPSAIPYNAGLVMLLSRLAHKTGSFLLVGTSSYEKFNKKQRETERVANSAFLFSPQGKIIGRYDKMRRLPFDEYIPLRGIIKWPSWVVAADTVDSRPGMEMTIFSMGMARFGVLICWENLFPDLFREMASKGVDFMVSMTNEGFTDVPAAHYQMLAMNVFRAVENHVAIVRINSTGVSGIIGPDGSVRARVMDDHGKDVDVEGYVAAGVPLVSQRTFYNRHGDWFVFALIIMMACFFAYTIGPTLKHRWTGRGGLALEK